MQDRLGGLASIGTLVSVKASSIATKSVDWSVGLSKFPGKLQHSEAPSIGALVYFHLYHLELEGLRVKVVVKAKVNLAAFLGWLAL